MAVVQPPRLNMINLSTDCACNKAMRKNILKNITQCDRSQGFLTL